MLDTEKITCFILIYSSHFVLGMRRTPLLFVSAGNTPLIKSIFVKILFTLLFLTNVINFVMILCAPLLQILQVSNYSDKLIIGLILKSEILSDYGQFDFYRIILWEFKPGKKIEVI